MSVTNNNRDRNGHYDNREDHRKSGISNLKFYAFLTTFLVGVGTTSIVLTNSPEEIKSAVIRMIPNKSSIGKYAKAELELKYLKGTAEADGKILDASNSILYDVSKEERAEKWHEYCQKIGLSEEEELELKEKYSELFYEKTHR